MDFSKMQAQIFRKIDVFNDRLQVVCNFGLAHKF